MNPEEELCQQRLEKLRQLQAQGIEPYGRRFDKRTSCAAAATQPVDAAVQTAGRVTARRAHGKSMFADIMDDSGRVQMYAKKDTLGEEQFALLRSIDLGDWVGVSGKLFETKTKQITIAVEAFQILSKSLRSMPEKWHGLKDQEVRYRQRYLDLLSNPDVRAVFTLRSRAIAELRRLLDAAGYLEVETPMMHPVAGGAAGEPFQTHHRALNLPLFLRLAPELYLKRLLVGGFERVYEISKSFRNEGTSPRHNPEFTMLESYTAYHNYEDVMRFVQHLVVELARTIVGATTMIYQDQTIHLDGTWTRVSFAELVQERYGVSPDDGTQALMDKIRAKHPQAASGRLSRSQVVRLVEEAFHPETRGEPTFVVDYWKELSPLAKAQRDHPALAERFELYLGGMEIANGYSELNDPVDQRQRFEAQLDGLPESHRRVDDDYVEALEYGMPPAGGLGVGIDRLVMLLANQPSIRDVILFPLLRPEQR